MGDQMATQAKSITRRSVFAIAGIGGVTALALGSQAHAASPSRTAEEAGNIKLVQDFIRGWTAKAYEPKQEMARYLSAQCVVRPIDTQPALTTPDAAAQIFIDFMKDGSRVTRVDFHQIMARGKMVVTNRDDIVKTPGKPDQVFKVVGVFVVNGGKIHEWTDYLIT
jgi:limonene-1,2-epoxide hydrolase